ncbi:hypothetical protein BD779DRAFT_827924 [Infundibulicybe gibba]|nr:hypothetical protein BD779DRAFT_827924 [Infundibulicybe gibba]
MTQAMVSVQKQTVDNTIGAAFLGVIASAFLFGITTLQAYWYFHRFWRQDTLLHRISVGVLWSLDTFHLFLTIHSVYHYIVTGFGHLEGLAYITWSIKLQVAANVIIILMVQSLYTFRVWLLSGYHRGVLGYLVVSVVAGGFGIGIVLAYEIYTVNTFVELDEISWAVAASLATATTIDFTIATAMCYYLRKSKGSESRLNSRISRVMQYTLSSGLFTSACSLSAMFTYILMPNNFIFLGLQFLLTRLYVGSFLAMLNARERIPPQHEEHSIGQSHLKLSVVKFQTPSLPSASSSDFSGSPVHDSNPKRPVYPWDAQYVAQ